MQNHVPVRFFDRSTPPHILTLVVLAGVSSAAITSFLPSLTTIADEFGADYAVIQLVVTLYLAVTAVMQLFIGPLADRFGRRPTALVGFLIFVISSLGCMWAQNEYVFLVFRMLQGVVATGLVLSRTVVRDMYPQDAAASMIGYVTMGMALVPMVAPAIGGALDAAFGWRSTLGFLAIIGVIALVMAWFDMGETAPKDRPASFRAQFREYPDLFMSRRFWGYALCAAFSSGVFFAYLGGAPYVATQSYGLTTVEAGIGFSAPAIGYIVGNYLSGRNAVRFGVNLMILAGAYVATAGMTLGVILSLIGLLPAWGFFGICCFIGLGNGLVLPSATSGMLSLRPDLAGTAAGLGGAIMIGGGAALSVLAGVVLSGQDSPLPLLILMQACSLLALAAIYYVRWREAELARVAETAQLDQDN